MRDGEEREIEVRTKIDSDETKIESDETKIDSDENKAKYF